MEFALLETMKLSPNGSVELLERHLTRLERTATYFEYACDTNVIHSYVLAEAMRLAAIRDEIGDGKRLRLLVSRDGSFELEVKPLSPERVPRRLRLSSVIVDSTDPFLRNKTTARGTYERARAGFEADTDVLLINEHGEVTETTLANVAMLRRNQWITPMTSCGLLPGTMREQLLIDGQIIEGVIRREELVHEETVRCFNSVRGVYDIPLLLD
jgi:para-aminobenzoate synthetase/4-amino-4-deoxychorismate lyase